MLERVRELAEDFRKVAEVTDQSPCVPREHLEKLAAADAFRLSVPQRYGGLEAPAATLWDAMETLAAGCGVTNFVQAQHVGGMGLLLRSQDDELIGQFLPPLMRGERFIGVAFAHVRRPRPTLCVEDGVWTGYAPWFTGWSLMDHVVLAGSEPDGKHLFVTADVSEIRASEPVQFSAMTASSTVTLVFEGQRLESQRVLFRQTREDMAAYDPMNQLRYSAPSLGCARAAARLLQEQGVAPDEILREAEELRAKALSWQGDPAQALQVRTRANALGLRAAQAALVAFGGGGNRREHPAQRLVREASFYFLSQLDPELRQSHLQYLTNR